MRAVIDIGSNSVLLLVGTRSEDGSVNVLHDDARITRLARGASATGKLDPDAIRRTVETLAQYRVVAERLGAPLLAVATEGLRIASDPEAFLVPAREALGCDVRMISGDEEARLSYLSVAHEQDPGPLRVIDIGGASTELVIGDGVQVHDSRSHTIGSVRLTERLIETDPPQASAIAAVASAAREAFASQPVTPHPELHGLAGTVTTAAALMLGLDAYDRDRIDRSRWTVAQVRSLRDELAALPLAERIRDPILPSGRADVIVAGLTILVTALEHCGAETLVTRDRGLRYALI